MWGVPYATIGWRTCMVFSLSPVVELVDKISCEGKKLFFSNQGMNCWVSRAIIKKASDRIGENS